MHACCEECTFSLLGAYCEHVQLRPLLLTAASEAAASELIAAQSSLHVSLNESPPLQLDVLSSDEYLAARAGNELCRPEFRVGQALKQARLTSPYPLIMLVYCIPLRYHHRESVQSVFHQGRMHTDQRAGPAGLPNMNWVCPGLVNCMLGVVPCLVITMPALAEAVLRGQWPFLRSWASWAELGLAQR